MSETSTSAPSRLSNPLKLAFVVGALSALGPFSTDTYFPSFPALAAHYGVTEIQMQATLSVYLMSLAGMNLFHGALSDSFGRRRVILTSLAAYTVTALACVFAPSFSSLLVLRFLQGMAAGAGMIVSRAVIRDLCDGVQAHKLMAQSAMLSGVAPVVAPILGGWLHVWFGWRGPFTFLTFLGIALWFACRFGLPESLPKEARQPFHPGTLYKAYLSTIRMPAFLLMCLSMALGAGGFLLYVATAPDVAINILHLSETQFGWLFVPIVSGLIIGSAVSGRMAGRVAPGRMIALGFGFMGLGSAINLAVNLFLAPRIPWAVMPLSIYTFGIALVMPVLTVKSLDLVPQRRGLASSLQGFSHVFVFALISWGAPPLVYRSGPRHALGLTMLMLLSGLCYLGARRFAVKPTDPPVRLDPEDRITLCD